MENNRTRITIDDFSELYKKYGPMVLRRCRYILKNEDAALDAMQDVFVRVIERHALLNSVCSSFFYTVATTVCLNKLRSSANSSYSGYDTLLNEIADNTTAFHEDITDTTLLLEAIFRDTRKDTQKIAVMHYIDGYTLEETAEEMNMSVSGIRKRLMVLRKKAQLYI
jgi:RNA polymerase sigma-70 factor, ECF subfamily